MLMYCKRCGRVVQDLEKCDICNSVTYKVPEKYWLNGKNFLINNQSKQQLFEECIKSSPEFDPELYNKKDAVIAKRWSDYKKSEAISDAIAQGADPKTAFKTAGNIPHCPICGSAKLSKISGAKKAIKIGLFGIFGAGDLGKTWKCENCGSKF